jgi:hypothetical protein
MSRIDLPENILPCPFCGYRRPYFYQRWAVECHDCGCGFYAPEASDELQAIQWWNAAPRLPAAELKLRRAEFLKFRRAERGRQGSAHVATRGYEILRGDDDG